MAKTFQDANSWNPHKNLESAIIIPIAIDEKIGTGRLNKLSKVKQLLSGRTQAQTQKRWLYSLESMELRHLC